MTEPKKISDTKKFTIEVEMKDRWIPHFLAMLSTMQRYGSAGMSRNVTFCVDGDGDFRPKFKWDDSLTNDAAPVKNDNGNVTFDAG